MSGGLSMYNALDQDGDSGGSSLEETVGGPAKKLARGISRATENAAVVSHARSHLAGIDTSEFTFSLPDLSIYPGFYNFNHFYNIYFKQIININIKPTK